MNDYYSAAEVETATANFAAAYPSLTELIVLPHITAEGRSSRALRLHGRADAGNPAVMIIAGVHGAEWGSCEIVLNLAADLLAAYSLPSDLTYGSKTFAKADLKRLLDSLDIVLFPLVNPDGRHCSRTVVGRELWRKNRNADYAGGDPEAVGVDINRNFGFLFDLSAFVAGAGVSATAAPAGDTYQGPHAFSEAETRNVRWLLDAHPSTGWFVDVHSPGQTIRYAWGDDEAQHHSPHMTFDNHAFDGQRGLPGDSYGEFMPAADRQAMHQLAQRLAADLLTVRGTAYGIGPAYTLTPYSGTSHDYAYSRPPARGRHGQTLGFFVEWGSTSQPDWTEMQEIAKEVSAGLIGFCLAAAGPPGGS